MHGEDVPDAVLDEGALDLLAGRQHREAVAAVGLVGHDAHRPYPAPRMALHGGGHPLGGARRADHEGGARPGEAGGAAPPVHGAAARAGHRRLDQEAAW